MHVQIYDINERLLIERKGSKIFIDNKLNYRIKYLCFFTRHVLTYGKQIRTSKDGNELTVFTSSWWNTSHFHNRELILTKDFYSSPPLPPNKNIPVH